MLIQNKNLMNHSLNSSRNKQFESNHTICFVLHFVLSYDFTLTEQKNNNCFDKIDNRRTRNQISTKIFKCFKETENRFYRQLFVYVLLNSWRQQNYWKDSNVMIVLSTFNDLQIFIYFSNLWYQINYFGIHSKC